MSKMIQASLWGVNLVPGDLFFPQESRAVHSLLSVFSSSAQRDCIVKIPSFSLDMDWPKGALFMV